MTKNNDFFKADFITKYEKIICLIVCVSIVALMMICWMNLFKVGDVKKLSKREYYEQYHIDHKIN